MLTPVIVGNDDNERRCPWTSETVTYGVSEAVTSRIDCLDGFQVS